MFATTKAFSGFSVDDVAAAKDFYSDTLGLRVSEANGLLTLHIAGDRDIIVYPKPDHTPATFTILNFPVADVEQAVDDLTERGVRFERYSHLEAEMDEKGIFRGGGPLIAWFTDPAGNVLSVIQEQ
jgi:catechol 2,3-dioxygenase-like lactoylglutathione lyase family enzyme